MLSIFYSLTENKQLIITNHFLVNFLTSICLHPLHDPHACETNYIRKRFHVIMCQKRSWIVDPGVFKVAGILAYAGLTLSCMPMQLINVRGAVDVKCLKSKQACFWFTGGSSSTSQKIQVQDVPIYHGPQYLHHVCKFCESKNFIKVTCLAI